MLGLLSHLCPQAKAKMYLKYWTGYLSQMLVVNGLNHLKVVKMNKVTVIQSKNLSFVAFHFYTSQELTCKLCLEVSCPLLMIKVDLRCYLVQCHKLGSWEVEVCHVKQSFD